MRVAVRALALGFVVACAGPMAAQVTTPPASDQTQPDTSQAPAATTTTIAEAKGAVVRWLDKVSGETVDLTLKDGESRKQGRITVTLTACRYPADDPSSNAYAFLTIHDEAVADPIFKGWMIAASPALNALDSARYDVWVLRCTTS